MLPSNKSKSSKRRFSFSFVEKNEIKKEIHLLQVSKIVQCTDTPTKYINENSDLVLVFIFSNLNDCIAQTIFLTALKLTDVFPVHKKDYKNSKENYRPVSFLPNISKAYEMFMFNQISEYFDSHCVKCPYLEFFWSVFPNIRTDTLYFFVFSPNAVKYGPKKRRI